MKKTEDIVQDAIYQFWQNVARDCPSTTTGDMSVSGVIAFEKAAKQAIEEWIQSNVPNEVSETD
jgi:hypothetical protein